MDFLIGTGAEADLVFLRFSLTICILRNLWQELSRIRSP